MDLNDKSKTICRICLEAINEEFDWIFKLIYTTGKFVKYSEMLMSFAAVNVTLSDGLPEQLCSNCARETIQTYAFKRKCEESDKYLRNLLEDRPDSMLIIDKIEIEEEDVIDKIIKSETTEECVLIEDSNQESEVKLASKEDNFTTNNAIYSIPERSSSRQSFATDKDILNEKKNERLDQFKTSEEEIDSLKETRRERSLRIRKSGESSVKHAIAKKSNYSENRSKQCRFCNKTFRTPSHTILHERIHTGEKPFECDICDKTFSQSGSLIVHKRLHTGERPYKCDFCKKGFTQSSGLSKHRRLHTGDKRFKCDYCDKKFVYSNSLICHKRIHTGEKPYECDICKKRFNQSNTLKKHVLIHTGEKPYECDICKKRFNQLSALKKHKITHTGVKPFKCDICAKTFTQSYNLAVHKWRHEK